MFYCDRGNNGNKDNAYIELEKEVLTPLAETGRLFALQVSFK